MQRHFEATGSSRVKWEWLARPQCDHYDSKVALDLARKRGLRLPVGKSNEPRFPKTELALRVCTDWDPQQFAAGRVDHPNLRRAADLLSTWPDGFRQVSYLLSAIYLATDRTARRDSLGGVSGPGPLGFGTIATTLDNPLGVAQAIVHEMAHHKLRALGIGVEAADSLVLNPQSELYQSPIRYDCLRPMSAVLHAQYSYSYVAALEIEIIKSAPRKKLSRQIVEYFLCDHIPKLDFGMRVILQHAVTDSNGARFLRGFREWVADIIASGQIVIAELGGKPRYFVHPLAR